MIEHRSKNIISRESWIDAFSKMRVQTVCLFILLSFSLENAAAGGYGGSYGGGYGGGYAGSVASSGSVTGGAWSDDSNGEGSSFLISGLLGGDRANSFLTKSPQSNTINNEAEIDLGQIIPLNGVQDFVGGILGALNGGLSPGQVKLKIAGSVPSNGPGKFGANSFLGGVAVSEGLPSSYGSNFPTASQEPNQQAFSVSAGCQGTNCQINLEDNLSPPFGNLVPACPSGNCRKPLTNGGGCLNGACHGNTPNAFPNGDNTGSYLQNQPQSSESNNPKTNQRPQQTPSTASGKSKGPFAGGLPIPTSSQGAFNIPGLGIGVQSVSCFGDDCPEPIASGNSPQATFVRPPVPKYPSESYIPNRQGPQQSQSNPNGPQCEGPTCKNNFQKRNPSDGCVGLFCQQDPQESQNFDEPLRKNDKIPNDFADKPTLQYVPPPPTGQANKPFKNPQISEGSSCANGDCSGNSNSNSKLPSNQPGNSFDGAGKNPEPNLPSFQCQGGICKLNFPLGSNSQEQIPSGNFQCQGGDCSFLSPSHSNGPSNGPNEGSHSKQPNRSEGHQSSPSDKQPYGTSFQPQEGQQSKGPQNSFQPNQGSPCEGSSCSLGPSSSNQGNNPSYGSSANKPNENRENQPSQSSQCQGGKCDSNSLPHQNGGPDLQQGNKSSYESPVNHQNGANQPSNGFQNPNVKQPNTNSNYPNEAQGNRPSNCQDGNCGFGSPTQPQAPFSQTQGNQPSRGSPSSYPNKPQPQGSQPSSGSPSSKPYLPSYEGNLSPSNAQCQGGNCNPEANKPVSNKPSRAPSSQYEPSSEENQKGPGPYQSHCNGNECSGKAKPESPQSSPQSSSSNPQQNPNGEFPCQGGTCMNLPNGLTTGHQGVQVQCQGGVCKVAFSGVPTSQSPCEGSSCEENKPVDGGASSGAQKPWHPAMNPLGGSNSWHPGVKTQTIHCQNGKCDSPDVKVSVVEYGPDGEPQSNKGRLPLPSLPIPLPGLIIPNFGLSGSSRGNKPGRGGLNGDFVFPGGLGGALGIKPSSYGSYDSGSSNTWSSSFGNSGIWSSSNVKRNPSDCSDGNCSDLGAGGSSYAFASADAHAW